MFAHMMLRALTRWQSSACQNKYCVRQKSWGIGMPNKWSSCLWGRTFLSCLASVVLRRSLPVQPLLLCLRTTHGLRRSCACKLRWSQSADSVSSQKGLCTSCGKQGVLIDTANSTAPRSMPWRSSCAFPPSHVPACDRAVTCHGDFCPQVTNLKDVRLLFKHVVEGVDTDQRLRCEQPSLAMTGSLKVHAGISYTDAD